MAVEFCQFFFALIDVIDFIFFVYIFIYPKVYISQEIVFISQILTFICIVIHQILMNLNICSFNNYLLNMYSVEDITLRLENTLINEAV